MSASRETLVVPFLAFAIAGLASPSAGTEPKFYDDDPLWTEPVTQNVKSATDYEPDIAYTYMVNFFGHPGEPLLGQPAKNVNTVDEVPDGPFFVNRAGRIPLTPELVARAANTDDGPAAGPWAIVSGKSSGVTPGFSIRDARGVKWYLKFDPIGWPAMATGSELVAAKLFWALGYHTAEYHIIRFLPADLVISDQSRIRPPGEAERPMRHEDLEQILARTNRYPDGSYRAIASKALPGTYVGRIRYAGTRADDPNDIVPHEQHRELRGYFVFCAWLDRVDAKREQSLVTLVTEGGRKFLRRYLIDWSSTLGSAGIGPRAYWQGYQQFVEPPGVIASRILTFGAAIPAWRLMDFYESPAVGRLPRDESSWDPDGWEPLVSNAAFRHALADDKFWAAYKMAFITEDMVRAVVAEAQFDDPAAEEHLVRDIMARRSRILAAYLPAIDPIVDPVLGKDGILRFRNAAVTCAAALPPQGYRAAWSTFDNATGVTASIGVTEASDTAVPAPALPAGSFVKVELSCVGASITSWEIPVTLYFRRRAGTWQLVGLDRR